ncbi:fimbrial biogenesis usher protein [Serratia fonticola]|jgi:outer membrane usher protein|uniref:fimbrial biogenesis usher protein n=1 Tax=Serratia fonticola TaxID=47917 RepID=UPI0014154203|nr:fimbrial biogenesis usher protein [Serratia fonticola]MBP0997062.1 fimbrial biogenesis usher protein [Serratia fonticola]MBP1002730.1 fimbrial biogenesis usher protein [Serratia fonticola]MBP1012521.1 fimbrial biogenesis usher protein [Serratia fonticola]MBP1018745.1 fimbrial biogenesis usher protein [Serratia fonticola]QIP92018.1 type 1 fimbriae anchoring protein FimD [Serratia fonticola]
MQYLKLPAYFRKNAVWAKLSLLPCFAIMGLSAHFSYAEEYFNPAFLSGDTSQVADLSRFSKGEGQPAGMYRVEVYINEEYINTQDIRFDVLEKGRKGADDTGLVPCLSRAWLENQDVNIQASPALLKLTGEQCADLPASFDKAQTRFEFERQRLDISIPQAAFRNNVRGYIPPERWDNGITAGLLDYSFSGSNSKNTESNANYNSYFLNLNSGLNIGSWRLRNSSTWNHSDNGRYRNNVWRNVNTYAQSNIIALKSSLTLGDSYTEGDVFDGVGFRGAQLASDDNMLPDSMRGFAPTVRGVANSSAQVTIRQNGYEIYQTYVPPGAFEITDLYPTSTSGDLQVSVRESNGTVSQFTVPYSAVPILQREGRVKYALTAGKFRSGSDLQDSPKFMQGTLTWGLPAGVTLYGGSQLSDNYQSFAFGAGKNLGNWGAVSADVTHARSVLPDDSQKEGQSLRFLYAKSLNDYGTNFQLLGYRYSTQGFYTLSETAWRQMEGYRLQTQDGPADTKPELLDYHNLYYSKKGRLQVNISQQVLDAGTVYVTGSQQTYWRTGEKDQLWQVGYSGNWEDINYNLNWSWNKSPGLSDADRRVAFNVSVPLSRWLTGTGKARDITNSTNTAYATYSVTHDSDNRVAQQAGVSGTLLDDNNLSYSVQQGHTTKGGGATGTASLSYQGRYANSNIGYSYGKHYQQVNYGLRGGVVAHADGVTLSQPLGDTNVLVKAPGADGVRVQNATGVSTDWRGYAVVPYATSYRANRIALDTTTLQDNAELDNAVTNVIPTKGALVRANFEARIGARAKITLTQRNGKPVPFGASVNDEAGGGGSIVGDAGQVFMSGLKPNGKLNVVWGHAASQQCTVSYQLSKDAEKRGISYARAVCL